jgi:hypothetical protein
MKLHIIIEQDEAGYYVAEVPALPAVFRKATLMMKPLPILKKQLKDGLK